MDNIPTSDSIGFTPEKLARFKEAYANALAERKQTFVFEGHGFLTAYAKFVIEYVEATE